MAQKYFGTNVPISSGFDINSQRPIDPRTVVETYSDLENIPNIQLYPGLEVYVEDEETKYYYSGSEWKNVSTQGPKGDKGDQGDKGDKGDPGVSATISIGKVTTGEAGSDAEVTNVGTDIDAVLDFRIPKADNNVTQEQVSTSLDQFFSNHPDMMTNIPDYSISNQKLQDYSVSFENLSDNIVTGTDIQNVYYSKVLYDFSNNKGIIKGNFVNDIPVDSVDGSEYYTPYIKFKDYESLSMIIATGSSAYTRFYDSDKNFIQGTWDGGIIYNNAPTNAEYIVVSRDVGNNVKITYNSIFQNYNLEFYSNGINAYEIVNTSVEIAGDGSYSDFIQVVKGETYIFSATGNGEVSYYNASEYSVKNATQGRNQSITIPIDGEITHLRIRAWNNQKGTLTGKFLIKKITYPELTLVDKNFNSDIVTSLRQMLNIGAGTGGVFYNAVDYGISTISDDNTAALQSVIDTIFDNGGGVLWIPKGTYYFKSSNIVINNGNMEGAVYVKSKVSIIGESLSGTVLKMTGESACGKGFSLFAYHNDTTPLEGCTYSNFTIDGSDMIISEYNHQGKAFYYHNIKDCVFRDLKLLNTPATALGIDMLVNTVIDSIYCENCGREWVYDTGNGGAGIGIGTGKFQNENYVIRNCICVGCGHFGIFLEDQGVFSPAKDKNYPKGAIITNNICRNGRYGGIGLRGGRYVLIQNNICYENKDAGIEIDYGTKDCDILNNICYANEESGIAIEDIVSGDKENLNLSGNRLSGNKIGMKINSPTSGLSIVGNIIRSNTSNSLYFIDNQTDTIVKNNIIIGDGSFQETYFIGTTSYNDLLSSSFLGAATLLDGTKGCGSVCSIDSDLNLTDIGDGDDSTTITYENTTANMKDIPEVSYE